MYAAPFDNNNSNNNNNINSVNESVSDNDIINKKKQHTKTQKRYYNENHDQQKVNTVLATIHQNIEDDNDSGDNLGDFNPPPPPQSIGAQRAKATEESKNVPVSFNNGNENDSNSNSIANNIFRALGKSPQPLTGNDNNLDLNNFNSNYADNKSAEEYYSKYLPGINNLAQNKLNKMYYQPAATQNEAASSYISGTNDVLLQKINYMINLLEEQQDEKTNNVTEEVVLYSFLGIFIIFVVDSFARVGKYTR